MPEHEHKWGVLEQSRLAGTWHRKCQVAGCRMVNIYDEDDDIDKEVEEPDQRGSHGAQTRSAQVHT